MNTYKVYCAPGIEKEIEADYIKSDCGEVIFYRTVSGKSDEFVAIFINPICVIREIER